MHLTTKLKVHKGLVAYIQVFTKISLKKRDYLLIILLLVILTAIYMYTLKKPNLYLRISSFSLLVFVSFYQLISTYSLIYIENVFSQTYLTYFIIALSFIVISFMAEKNMSILHTREFNFIPISLTLGLLTLLYASTVLICSLRGLCELNVLLFVEILSFLSIFLVQHFSWYHLKRTLNAYFPFGAIIILQLIPKVLQGETINLVGFSTLILFFIVHFFMLYKIHLPQKTLYRDLGILLLIFVSSLYTYVLL